MNLANMDIGVTSVIKIVEYPAKLVHKLLVVTRVIQESGELVVTLLAVNSV